MADFDVPIEEQTLRGLEERLERATRAAERLLAEAAADVAQAAASEAAPADGPAAEVPPSGWQRRGADGPAAAGRWIEAADAERLLSLLAAVLDRLPLELQQRLVAALRELLLALRALVDWCLQRAERRRAAPAEVQDIPIL